MERHKYDRWPVPCTDPPSVPPQFWWLVIGFVLGLIFAK
jgi:hypothetical protein